MTTVDRLNELLEAERAGVETLSRLFPEARSFEMQKLFEGVRNDEAWACAGLVRSITTLLCREGDERTHLGRPSPIPQSGQGWVVKRLDALTRETLPESVGEFLEEMKARHVTNIEACERLADSLD
jgi:hypothetical protein